MSNRIKQSDCYNKKEKQLAYWSEGIPMPHFYPNRYALEKRLQNLSGKDVLDFGSGCGQFSYYFARKGAKVTAVDISEKNISDLNALAKAHNVTISSHVASVDECPFHDASFDVIFGSAILHHLEVAEEKSACQEVFRLLRNDGLAVFIEPLENFAWFNKVIQYVPVNDKYTPRPSKLTKKYEQFIANEHHPKRPLTTTHFIDLFTQCGFEVVVKEIGIFNRIDRLTRNVMIRRFICALDYYILQYLVPFRKGFCRNIVIVAKKRLQVGN